MTNVSTNSQTYIVIFLSRKSRINASRRSFISCQRCFFILRYKPISNGKGCHMNKTNCMFFIKNFMRCCCAMAAVVCFCSPVLADSAPDCASGSCQEASWNEDLQMFEYCHHEGTLQCTCYENRPGHGWGTYTYPCACMSDGECSNGYCMNGVCHDCVSGSSGCSGTTRTKVDDCNYYDTTLSFDCRDGCLSSTSYGCYTGSFSDTKGTYTCQ